MKRVYSLAFIFAVLLALPAAAEERKLTGEEIHELLAGNSIHGMIGQDEYKSSFSADDSTLYGVKGRDPDAGSWRTTADRYPSELIEGEDTGF